MARRRRKGGIPKFAIVALIVVFVGGGLILALPSLTDIGLFGGGGQFTAQTGNSDFWSIPNSFYFALAGDFDGVHCWIALTLTQFNDDGTTEILASNSGVTVELLEITGGFSSSAKEVRLVKVTPRLSCQDTTSTTHDIRLQGGTIRLESFVKDKVTGAENKVDSRFVVIPALNRNLKVETGGGNIILPSLTSSASTIESFINVPDTVASRNIDVTFKTSSWANIAIDGTTFKAGDLQAGLGGLLKFINPDFGASDPTTTKGTQVTMTSINPIQHHYIGNSGVVPAGVTSSSQVVTLNDEIRATFTGTEDNWSSAEGIPTLTLKDPKGITRSSGTPMTTISNIGGGLTQFSRIGVSIPFQINDNNIDQVEGTWRAEMHQAGRTAIGVKTFVLLDSRPVVVDPDPDNTPDCDPVTEQIVNGKCEPVSEEPMGGSCPTAIELGEIIDAMKNDEVIATFNQLDGKTRDTCENTTFILIQQELSQRGLDPSTQPPTSTTGAKGFIRYDQSLTDETGAVGGGGGCPDRVGIVPQEGTPLLGFQLIGTGSCEGFRFGSVKLTPTLDFGSGVSDITIDSSSIILQQDLFLAKNKNFPASPDVSCTPVTSTSIGTCSVTNYAFVENPVGDVQLSPNQVTFVRQFVDKATSGEYAITDILLQENALIDKIQRNGVALSDGDDISLMYLIWGKFSGTKSGTAFSSQPIPPLTYVQNFKFKSSVGGAECLAPSQIVIFPNPEDPDAGDLRLASGSETGQCLPCNELEDLGLVSSCPREECPAGTQGTFPQCTIIDDCVLPNVTVDGVCRPPTDLGCPSPQVRDPITNECRDPVMCFQDPVCGADEKFAVTEELDDCKANKLICVPKTTTPTTPLPCPNPDTQFRDSLGICTTINPTGCPEGQSRNSLGICEDTGTTVNPEPPTGNNCEEGQKFNEETRMCETNFCAFDSNFNFAQCFAQIFAGAGSLTAGGEPDEELTGLLTIVVLVIIIIIIVAVVIRVRRGRGFGT